MGVFEDHRLTEELKLLVGHYFTLNQDNFKIRNPPRFLIFDDHIFQDQ